MTLLAALAAMFVQAPARPAQIVIIRHAEKPADTTDPHLSPLGVQRARKLVGFLTTDPAMTKFGPAVAVFATATTKHDDGQRTQETVAPTAKALGLPVQTPFHGSEYASLARQILGNSAYAGKTVIVCWNHEEIPQLTAALGVKPQPPPWKGKVFDRVYRITYRNGKATMEDLPETLGRRK
jgi:hypothetical protein